MEGEAKNKHLGQLFPKIKKVGMTQSVVGSML